MSEQGIAQQVGRESKLAHLEDEGHHGAGFVSVLPLASPLPPPPLLPAAWRCPGPCGAISRVGNPRAAPRGGLHATERPRH